MSSTYVKPQVIFPMFPLIFRYIECAYNKVETMSDFVDFVNGCLNEAETTKNSVKKSALTTIANALYSVEVGTSYESKKLEISILKIEEHDRDNNSNRAN